MVESVLPGAFFSPVGWLPLASIFSTLLGLLMAFLSIFLILLILIQRGRGGGLAGALGGPGGQSAFGSKAGDTFTLITIVVASVWGFVCAFATGMLGVSQPPAMTGRETTMQGGPGNDLDDVTDDLIIPTDEEGEQSGDNASGEGGSSVGSLFSGEENVELTPAMPETDPAEADPAETDTATTEAESSDSADTAPVDDQTAPAETTDSAADLEEESDAQQTVTETTPGE